MFSSGHAGLFAFVGLSLLGSCGGQDSAAAEDCNREGCALLTKATPQAETGVAGIISRASDVVSNSCQECPLADATLRFWKAGTAVSAPADAAPLVAVSPDVTLEASANFQRTLSSGNYLLCVRSDCTGIQVIDGETLTVNVKQRAKGPTSFFLARPADAAPAESFGFQLSDSDR